MSQSLIDAAKASILAYNDKNWDAVSNVLTSDVEYRRGRHAPEGDMGC